MAKSKRLIIGLGNPGSEYEETRHNIGFAVIDALAEKLRVAFEHAKGNVLLGWGRVRSFPVGLAKPLTYMNRSGSAVKTLLAHHGLEPRDVLVVVDDVNLPVGKLRIRPGGSAGGHNGLQDITDRLGCSDFPRLRFGVGSDFARGRQAEYVLSPFTADELPIVEQSVLQARDAAIAFVTDGVVAAMNQFN